MDSEDQIKNLHIRIGELSALSGVPKTTIHFYIREGLLHPPAKTSRTMAYYNQNHLDRLLTIQKAKTEMNLSFSALKDMMAEVNDPKKQGLGDDLQESPNSIIAEDLKNSRREKIVEAAIKIFTLKSFHYASVKDIAKAAGISTGTFYLFFPDKLQLFICVLQNIISNLRQTADSAVSKEADSVRKMAIRARLFFKFFENYSGILYQKRPVQTGDSGFSNEGLKMIYSVLLEPVIRQIREEEELGIIRKTNPELLAYSLMGIITIMSFRKSFDDKYSEEQIIEFLADFMINGIGPIKNKT